MNKINCYVIWHNMRSSGQRDSVFKRFMKSVIGKLAMALFVSEWSVLFLVLKWMKGKCQAAVTGLGSDLGASCFFFSCVRYGCPGFLGWRAVGSLGEGAGKHAAFYVHSGHEASKMGPDSVRIIDNS